MCDKENFDKLVEFIQGSNDRQTKELKTYLEKEIAEIRKEVAEERERRIQLEEEHKKLKQKYDILEKSFRKNNIVIFGIEDKRDRPLLDITLETLNTHLNLNIVKQDINNIYNIGKQNQNKPIIVKFVSFLTKLEILKSTKKLKGTSISISEDLSLEERKLNKVLRSHLIEARAKGLTAYIKNNKLNINNEERTADQLLCRGNNIENEEAASDKSTTNTKSQKPHLPSEQSETHHSSSVKKRGNGIQEDNKEVFETDSKKRKVGTLTSNPRSSPRLNDKEVQQKSTPSRK